MRGIPGLCGRAVVEASAVMVADHRASVAAVRPVAARAIVGTGNGGSFGRRAGEDVVQIRRTATSIHDFTLFIQCRLLLEVVHAVQLGDILRDDATLLVLPGPYADPIACVHRRAATGRARAQVSAPLAAFRFGRFGQRDAVLVGTGKAAEIRAFAGV